MNDQLPQLSSMIIPAFFTLFKNKNIDQTGVQFTKTFKNVEVEKHNLEKFRSYFDFNTKAPLTYLYTLAQRAQTALMLDNRFTLPIPGMVHIENLLIKKGHFNPHNSFDITSSVLVEYKASSSLKPVFVVDLSQNDNLVATCKSSYIIKRKSKNSKSKKLEIELLQHVDHEAIWNLTPKMGEKYADISGDKNPIHTSLIFAKILGFKKQIMHGWYSVCKIEQFLEESSNIAISEISVNFLSPVLLPSQPKFEIQNNGNGEFKFQLVKSSNAKTLLLGLMK